MLTIEDLKEYGADTDSGVKRCANNEKLYLRLVETLPNNQGFNDLYEAIKNNNLEDGFKIAHGLKGILTNLSMNPLSEPIILITEHLRNKDKIDYSLYLKQIEEKRKELELIIK